MGRIIVFTRNDCSFCQRAKKVLQHRCLPFVEIPLTTYPERRKDMEELSGQMTVPSIFLNDQYLPGGCDGLTQLLDEWDDRSSWDASMSFWQVYLEEVATQPDPMDPRLAHPMTPLGLSDERLLQDCKDPLDMAIAGHSNHTTSSTNEDEHIGYIRLPDGTHADLGAVTSQLVEHMPRQKLAYLAKFYTDCFPGDQGVDKLLEIFPALVQSHNRRDRQRAVEFGRLLQRCGVIHHVCDEHSFQDTPGYYYRLQPFHQPHVLNSFQSQQQVALALPNLIPMGVLEHEDTSTSDPHLLTTCGALKLLTKLQTLLADIEVRATALDGIDYLQAKDYNDPAFVQLEEGSCRLQCMDAISLACTMTNAEKTVFGIHLYNVMVRHANIKLGVPTTASQRRAFFTGVNYKVANQILSLDDVEHGILRVNTRHPYHLKPQFVGEDPRKAWTLSGELDPRIHFTLYCGAASCPPINNYTVGNLDQELQLAAESFCLDDNNVVVDEVTKTLTLSMIFKWYKSDFGCASSKNLPEVVLNYLPKDSQKHAALASILAQTSNRIAPSRESLKVKFMPYDWAPQAAPGKFLKFSSSALKTSETSIRAPFSNKRGSLTSGGRPMNLRNRKPSPRAA